MIISLLSLNYEDLKKQLLPEDKIVLYSCNACVKACGIAGTEKMDKLAEMLISDGYNVIGTDLISIGCTANLIEKRRIDMQKKVMYDAATVVIPLICEDGFEGAEHVFKDKKLIPVAKTVGIGNFTADRGVVLTTPFESTGLALNADGYTISELADQLNLQKEFFDSACEEKQNNKSISLKVNGEIIQTDKGENLLTACLENGIDIPHLCSHNDLSDYGACRMCLVKIKGFRDLAPACCVEVQEGMDVCTVDEELNECRETILELVMASGQHNCLTCAKGIPSPMGACELQGLIRNFGIEESSYDQNIDKLPEDSSSPVIMHDPNKCILCGRCVRACEEIAGLSNIGFVNRGDKTAVVAGLNVEMNQSACAGCKVCIDVCPTGALTEKVLYFSGSEWTPSRKYVEL